MKNGALIGAIIGGIALGGFVGWLCNMLQEPSDPSCLPASLLYTGVGVGIGAAAGAGVDALFVRQSRAKVGAGDGDRTRDIELGKLAFYR